MSLTPVWHLLHLAGVVVWVGGMHFAHMCLRPAAAELLEPPARLRLLRRIFDRFLPWVAVAIGAVLASGGAMFSRALDWTTPHAALSVMAFAGLAMTVVFLRIRFAPYPALCRAVDAEDWKLAGVRMATIRQLVLLNLMVGWFTIIVATVGRLAG